MPTGIGAHRDTAPGARFGYCGVPGEGETCDVKQASLRFRPGRDRRDGP